MKVGDRGSFEVRIIGGGVAVDGVDEGRRQFGGTSVHNSGLSFKGCGGVAFYFKSSGGLSDALLSSKSSREDGGIFGGEGGGGIDLPSSLVAGDLRGLVSLLLGKISGGALLGGGLAQGILRLAGVVRLSSRGGGGLTRDGGHGGRSD